VISAAGAKLPGTVTSLRLPNRAVEMRLEYKYQVAPPLPRFPTTTNPCSGPGPKHRGYAITPILPLRRQYRTGAETATFCTKGTATASLESVVEARGIYRCQSKRMTKRPSELAVVFFILVFSHHLEPLFAAIQVAFKPTHMDHHLECLLSSASGSVDRARRVWL
jgi:hypothetical protein